MIMVLSMLQCPSKTLLEGVSGFLGIVDPRYAHRSLPEVSNPCLQSFEGIFKSFVEQVGVNLSCVYGCMSECLLHDKDVRGTSIQSGCEAMSQAVRCNPLRNSGFDYPLIETALDLTSGYSFLQLAEKKCRAFAEDLFALFQVPVKNCAQLSVEKAIDDLSTFGFDSDLLLQQVDVVYVQINQFGKSDAGMQEEINDDQIAVGLPALVMSDCFQENTFLILSQENRRFSTLVIDLDGDCGIMIDLTDVGQPPEEAFDRSPGTIDGRCHFRLTSGLFLHWTRKQEGIDITGCDIPDIMVTSKPIEKQIQIALLGSNRVRRSAIGKLVIQELSDRLIECHNSSSESSSGCQLQIDWLVMYRQTFLPMYSLIGSVILRSPTSMKVSLFSLKVTSASELSYRSDFTMAIRSISSLSVIFGLLSLSSHADEFAFVGNGEFRKIARPDSHPASTGLYFIACSNTGELKSISLAVDFFLKMSEAVKLPTLGLCPLDELFFLHFPHCGFLFWLGLVSKFTVQGCAGTLGMSSQILTINVTVRW